MSRIDAIVATQVGDGSRARQSAQDLRLQAETARSLALRDSAEAQDTVRADDVRAAAAELKQVVETATSRRLGFDVHEGSGELFVRVTDQETGDVVKQIPSEAVLRMRDRLHEMIGVFVNESA